jgi:hypothetical protein
MAKKTKAPKVQQINEKEFKNLLRQCKNLKKKAGDAASEMGGLISNAAEFKHLDKTAFSMYRRLDAMDTQKLATTIACFDFYRDIGGLDERVKNEPDLGIERPEAGSNITPIREAAE